MPEPSRTGFTPFNPPTVPAPAGRYSQGVLVPAGARLLYVSGQIGAELDGSVPSEFTRQAENAWRSLLGVLEAAGMTADNLVKVTAFLTRPADLGAYRTVRNSIASEIRPASTLVFVAALADPRWLVEIEAVAAQVEQRG
jgi:2-iminobutanoate/2-iminopropanoate deaminase